MRINSSTTWVLLAALFSSAAAQDAKFTFDGGSFTSPLEDFGGSASVFRFDNIRDGKNFTLNKGGYGVNITRLDLMNLGPNEESSTLASWCPDMGCTSTVGFSRSSSSHFPTDLNKLEMTDRLRMQ